MLRNTSLSEDEILARVLYRDGMMLVLDKPAGIAVHATGHDLVGLDRSFQFLQFGLPKRPELAHRLDRGTSGCLVLGRHRQALVQLGKLFEAQKITKTYRAVCEGVPAEPQGVIDRAILKSGQGSKWHLSLDDAGQRAVTEYRVVREINGHSEIEFSPKTGRTHQIRLHAAFALGCPIVGDPFYSPQSKTAGNPERFLLLHAESIEIPLYKNKPPVTVKAPLPEYWKDWA